MSAKQEVETLVYHLSKAGDGEIPRILLKIEELLEKYDGNEIRMLLWENEILSTITDVIKQDFVSLRVPWSTATKLVVLLAKSCLGLSHPTDFLGVFLPLVVDSCMELANNIQGSLTEGLGDEFQQCVESIFWLVDYSPALGLCVIDSPRLLTMLMTESSPDIDVSILKLLRSVLTQPALTHSSIPHDKLLVLFDEVMLKMTERDLAPIQQIGADVIYNTAKRNASFKEILLDNSEEVLELLNSINTAPGAMDNVNTLLQYIHEVRHSEAEQSLLNTSATKIQAHYRGYRARRQLQDQSRKVSKFQLRFREWLREKREREGREREEEIEGELQTQKARIRRRQRLVEEASKLQTLPAYQISSHRHQVRSKAASKIQAVWRMCVARKEVDKMRRLRVENRAAATIQRHYRSYRRGVGMVGGMLPPGLTAEKVATLHDRIQKLAARTVAKEMESVELEDLVTKSQEMYLQYTRDMISIRRVQKRRENLCSQISDRLTQLQSAPSLEDSSVDDAKLLMCGDPVIMAQAHRNHLKSVSAVSSDIHQGMEYRNSRLKYNLISSTLDMELKFSPLTQKIQQLEPI